MHINKLSLTFIFLMTISVYTNAVKFSFNVLNPQDTGLNYVVCLGEKCDYNRVTVNTGYEDEKVGFYINQVISYINDKGEVKEKNAYKEIIWHSSCTNNFSVCQKKSNNSFSDILCYTIPSKTPKDGIHIQARSMPKDGNLIIYGCTMMPY